MKNLLIYLFLIVAFSISSCSSGDSGNSSSRSKSESNSNRSEETTSETSESSEDELSNAEVEQLMAFYNDVMVKYRPEFSGCSGDPTDLLFIAGRKAENAFLDQFPISEADEEQYGEEMHQEVIKEFRLIDSDSRRQKLQTMLDKMLPHRERKAIEYDIHLIDDDEMINAFAIVGGHLYITTALLDYVDSDDELAFIIGHELGHVDKKHTVRKVQKLVIGNSVLGDIGVMAANFQIFVSAPFGQADEYEADRMGAFFANKAGYNTSRFGDFFRKIKQDETYDPIQKMLRTHPYSEQREVCLDKYIDEKL